MEGEEKKRGEEEEKLEVEDKSDLIMSVFLKEVKMETLMGIAIINMAERKFLVSEFVDNAFFSNLENVILQVTDNDHDAAIKFKFIMPFSAFPHLADKFRDLCGVCEVQFAEASVEDYSTVHIQKMFDQLLNPKAKFLLNEAEMDVALAALCGGIQHLKLMRDQTNFQQFTIETYKHTQFMRLDVAATRALNVFPPKFAGTSSVASGSTTLVVGGERPFGLDSLYSLFNQCKTKIGSRLLKKWLMHPLQDLNEIETRLTLVGFLKDHRLLRQTLQRDYLRLLPDIELLCYRFYKVKAKKKTSASLADCVKAYHMVQSLKKLGRFMAQDPDCNSNSFIQERYTSKIIGWCNDYTKLEELIEVSIDFEKVSQHEYVIHPRFSQDLQELKDRITTTRQAIEDLRANIMRDLGVDKDKFLRLVESAGFTYLFEMNKKEAAEKIRLSKKSYKVVNSKKSTLSFTCAELQTLCKQYTATLNQYRAKQVDVTNKVLEIVASYYPIMEATTSTVSELDVLIAFAQVADTAPNPYTKPILREGGELRLKDSRHPLIEWNKPTECIPNDCVFNYKDHTLHVITGLNMGGKSTYIRQVGICVYLAHVGCFVPCKEAEIPLIDCIIARVGAADHQLRGISTFLAEMLEVTCMLKSATNKSLLLVDEIGRGTSTNDGFGLAWAIAEHIATNLKSLCLFATHFGEITAMANRTHGVKNYYVDAAIKDGEITMLYKIREGTLGKSYGIHVAEILGFPADVVDYAKTELVNIENLFDAHQPNGMLPFYAWFEQISLMINAINIEIIVFFWHIAAYGQPFFHFGLDFRRQFSLCYTGNRLRSIRIQFALPVSVQEIAQQSYYHVPKDYVPRIRINCSSHQYKAQSAYQRYQRNTRTGKACRNVHLRLNLYVVIDKDQRNSQDNNQPKRPAIVNGKSEHQGQQKEQGTTSVYIPRESTVEVVPGNNNRQVDGR
eukprot:TRINITY_DN919_c0_g1_i1.p1 TRINITY_DN919_c0_g1~~TRINITY_DN919_c0_g1_i1.p1  ORF type:complete len:955 (-),score=56.16 TRINITY_DN919_c0_g1_i1:19038-21902(-)